eukprot:5138589-Alexandrium_andersonii.AAC.1
MHPTGRTPPFSGTGDGTVHAHMTLSAPAATAAKASTFACARPTLSRRGHLPNSPSGRQR